MKVLNIIEEARVGGPQIRIVSVSKELKQFGVMTEVLMPVSDSDVFVGLLKKNEIAYECFQFNKLGRKISDQISFLVSFPGEVFRLKRVIKSKEVDVVHVSGGSWQWKGIFAAKLAGIPVIWHLNDTYTPQVIRLVFHGLKHWASGFIFASHRTRKYYDSKLSLTPYDVIPAPVDFDKITTGDKIHTNEHPCLGVVANINPVKGLDVLIDALWVVKQQIQDVKLIVVGQLYETQRSYFETLKQRVDDLGLNENIQWVHNVTDVGPWLKSFDIYCCSSRFESSPIAVWEALGAGLPIVATDVGDVSTLLKEQGLARVVPCEKPEMLASALLESIYSLDEMKEKSFEKSPVFAANNFAPNVIAEKTFELYKAVLKNR